MGQTGLDSCVANRFSRFAGKKIGLVCHQASVDSSYVHILDRLMPLHRSGELTVQAVFGPQHGIWGHTQDNMVEWEGYTDPRTGLRFYSLYGEHREPSAAMLHSIDELVIDLQDVGARYYTFIWTTALCMKACAEHGIPVTVLDRPNPIGRATEGPGHDPAFASFVGLHPLPVRHGLSIGEIALYLRDRHYPGCQLGVEWSHGEGEFPWAMPSPNMPTRETALVYPGMCLLEGTELSEGRGTTKPFEIFGAPFIDGWELADHLRGQDLEGVVFRPVQFLPTFQKHAGTVCQGCCIHVTNPATFRPVLSAVSVLAAVRRLWPDDFAWQNPPYEYEYKKLPIDILAGGPGLRGLVDRCASRQEIQDWIDEDGGTLVAKTSEWRRNP